MSESDISIIPETALIKRYYPEVDVDLQTNIWGARLEIDTDDFEPSYENIWAIRQAIAHDLGAKFERAYNKLACRKIEENIWRVFEHEAEHCVGDILCGQDPEFPDLLKNDGYMSIEATVDCWFLNLGVLHVGQYRRTDMIGRYGFNFGCRSDESQLAIVEAPTSMGEIDYKDSDELRSYLGLPLLER